MEFQVTDIIRLTVEECCTHVGTASEYQVVLFGAENFYKENELKFSLS